MKASAGATGTGVCAKALEDVTPHRGPDAGKETLGMQPGGLKTPTSVSAVKAHVGCIRDQGPWAGTRLPKHAGKRRRCGCSFGRTGGDGLKGKPHVDYVFTTVLLVSLPMVSVVVPAQCTSRHTRPSGILCG